MKKNLRYFMTLLLMMVASVGWGADELYYTLDGTQTGGNNGYAAESEITQNNMTWGVIGNTTLDPWRIGGKSLTNENREAYSKTPMGSAISKVELTVGAASSITVNSLKLTVASDAAFENKIDEVTATFAANSTITFTPTTGTEWATGAYYKFIFNVTVSGSSNKFVEFSSATFFKTSSGTTPTVAKPTFSPAAGEVESGTQVTIVTPEGASGVMYSFDGETYQNYTSPIEITEETTIYAKAYDSDNNYSEVVSAAYTIKQDTPEPAYETVELPYEEKLVSSQGKFVIENVSLGGLEAVWKTSSYGMTANGNKCTGDIVSWFVSPLIKIDEVASVSMTFDQNVRYFASTEVAKEQATLWVREGAQGTWAQLTIPTLENVNDNNFSSAGTIDLSAYTGKTIQLGFKYLATTKNPGRWELKNLLVQAGEIVQKEEAGLSYDVTTFTATIGEDVEFPVLSNPNELEGITYSSSREDVATIDENGAITLVGAGQTTIKAAFAGNDSYNAGDASYMLVVKEKEVAGTDKFELVTDVNNLADGDVIILVGTNEDASYALSTTQNSNNRAGDGVSIDEDGTITPGSSIQQITLKEGFYFNVGDGYLYAASKDKNWLRTEDTADDNAKATISIAESGDATIVFQGSNTRNYLRFNPNNGNPIFSCYASTSTTGTAVKIYKKQAAAEDATITISSAGQATFSATKTYAIPEGLKAYVVTAYSQTDNNVTLTPLTSVIPANTGVVVKGNAGTYELTESSESETIVTNYLKANTTATELAATTEIDGTTYYNYTLAADGFKHSSGKGILKAGKAYLQILYNVPPTNAKLSLVFDGEGTGINNVNANDNANNKIFNLSGQRVGASFKGLVIKNGKKYINK
jgi:hypothetical protein